MRHEQSRAHGARHAFGLSGIVDPDEAERIGADASAMRDVSPRDDLTRPALAQRSGKKIPIRIFLHVVA